MELFLAILILFLLILPGVPFTAMIFFVENVIYAKKLQVDPYADINHFFTMAILVAIPVVISAIVFLFYLGFIYLPIVWSLSYLGCWGIIYKMGRMK